MIFGGFSTTSTEQPLPVGAALLAPGSAAWRLGDGPAAVLATAGGYRRVLVLGHCGARDFELSLLAEAGPPPDVTWRWPGTYTVVEETPAGAVVHTDPASAQPVYATRWRGGWAWSTSSRLLASLIGAAIDTQLVAASGVALYNPFLDPLVVDAVLATPLGRRPPLHVYKPVLARAMSGLLPPETAARATKGSFDADHYTGLRVNQSDLSALADNYLAALGLLQPGPFRRHLAQAAAGLPMPLATLEQALTVEAWLTAHHRDPAPTWTVPAGSEFRG